MKKNKIIDLKDSYTLDEFMEEMSGILLRVDLDYTEEEREIMDGYEIMGQDYFVEDIIHLLLPMRFIHRNRNRIKSIRFIKDHEETK